MEPPENLYRAVGKLFYAIAAIDETIHLTEYDTLIKLIGKECVTATDEKEVFTPTSSKEIINSFYESLLAKTPAYYAFKEFVSYKKTHEQELTPEIKKWIWQIADRITYSFAGKNKSEVIILSKLKSKLLE